jgi:hypothetical protein
VSGEEADTHYHTPPITNPLSRPILTTEQQELLDAIINEWQDGCNISSRIG